MRARWLSSFGLGSLFLAAACGAGGSSGATGSGGASSSSSSGSGGAGASTVGAGGAGGSTGTGGASTTTTTGSGGAGATTGSGGSGGSGGMACPVGSADCNGIAADGCEANLFGDAKNCGMCGMICAGGPNAPASCVAGTCDLVCPPGSGNCDQNAENGCEKSLLADPLNCGACGVDCMGASCVQGACACAAESKTANPVQLDLFIMLDKSGSMTAAVQGGGTRWSAVTTALKGFINDPNNVGLGVGIQYFGLPPSVACPPFCLSDADCGGQGPCLLFQCFGCLAAGTESCTVSDYATPEVEIGPLGGQQSINLVNSINSKTPDTNTPTAPALSGAILHAHDWAVAHPTHGVVVVFATDGEPTECSPLDIPSIANIAANGLNGSPSIKTFVIGVGDAVADLNALAVSGGTGSAFFVDTNANVVQQFEAALNAIQQSALGCEYTIPQPQMGMLDYNKVNVQYTPGNGAPQLIANVANAAACDPGSGGWYYDDNAAPTKIILCPKTCASVQADMSAKIDILLGCATQHQ